LVVPLEPFRVPDPKLIEALEAAGFDTSQLSPLQMRLTFARVVRDLHEAVVDAPRFSRP
jgi:hypothetical protein